MTSEQKDSYDSYPQYARLDLDPGTPGLIAPPRADSPLEPCSRLQSPSTATTMPPCPVPPDRRRLQDRNRNVLGSKNVEYLLPGELQEFEAKEEPPLLGSEPGEGEEPRDLRDV